MLYPLLADFSWDFSAVGMEGHLVMWLMIIRFPPPGRKKNPHWDWRKASRGGRKGKPFSGGLQTGLWLHVKEWMLYAIFIYSRWQHLTLGESGVRWVQEKWYRSRMKTSTFISGCLLSHVRIHLWKRGLKIKCFCGSGCPSLGVNWSEVRGKLSHLGINWPPHSRAIIQYLFHQGCRWISNYCSRL